ncbi:MAG: cryptochrome/photolyase family protein [Arenimonas sp.]|uniref:cryptochrome/photolyase family protein n=1 Tax=Arenimonas sp. TaxID=1872635 RepID=UPI003C080AA8
MNTVRLLLGDQLNPLHPWFDRIDPDVLYVFMEIRQETDYVLHHAQKILAIFAGMRELARRLRADGHHVHYIAIDDPDNRQNLTGNLEAVIAKAGAPCFEWQAPDEYRLDHQLDQWFKQSGFAGGKTSSRHFLANRFEAGNLFSGKKQWRMENFYRNMRRKHGVLLEPDGSPVGGQWNFDAENRKPWRGQPPEPVDRRPHHDHSLLWQTICQAGVQSFGNDTCADFRWPLHRDEALDLLASFIRDALPHFGDYQDAMSTSAPRLFHSLLSFALNVKMLNPREVIAAAETAWRNGHVPLAAAEGFIRQILGWREYIRGVYWAHMPGYENSNVLEHQLPLPDWFWTGNTKMRCLAESIGNSLEHAHAHHIQRLMVIGNFALLAGLDPQALHRWYLGVYIDAFEWVELPNTLGMSQFADGGLLASKPYAASAAYMHRMGDYCRGCRYKREQRTGPEACPYNALYWDFHLRHAERLSVNPRIGMVYRNLAAMDTAEIDRIRQHAAGLRARLDGL